VSDVKYNPRGSWCDIVFNAHGPTEIKVMVQTALMRPRHRLRSIPKVPHPDLVRGFQSKCEEGRSFRTAIWNESLHYTSNNNTVGVVNHDV